MIKFIIPVPFFSEAKTKSAPKRKKKAAESDSDVDFDLGEDESFDVGVKRKAGKKVSPQKLASFHIKCCSSMICVFSLNRRALWIATTTTTFLLVATTPRRRCRHEELGQKARSTTTLVLLTRIDYSRARSKLQCPY